jgi:hypothetical protein
MNNTNNTNEEEIKTADEVSNEQISLLLTPDEAQLFHDIIGQTTLINEQMKNLNITTQEEQEIKNATSVKKQLIKDLLTRIKDKLTSTKAKELLEAAIKHAKTNKQILNTINEAMEMDEQQNKQNKHTTTKSFLMNKDNQPFISPSKVVHFTMGKHTMERTTRPQKVGKNRHEFIKNIQQTTANIKEKQQQNKQTNQKKEKEQEKQKQMLTNKMKALDKLMKQ